MIGKIPTGALASAEISAVVHEGLTIKLANGQAGKLAILDDAGQIIDKTPSVATEVWRVSIACYKNFLIGNGHIRVHSEPELGIGDH